MNFDLLLNHVSDFITLTQEEKSHLISLLKYKKLKRKQQITQEGDVNRYASFIISGVVRMYSIDKNGFEHIIQFAPPGWWIVDMQSFLKQKPGNLYVEAIEASDVLQILKSDVENLFASFPKFERYFRILAENSLATYQQRFANSLSLSAKERYQSFCELYPSLIQRLPQKYVASYIGVTPEFLSKMLNQPLSSK